MRDICLKSVVLVTGAHRKNIRVKLPIGPPYHNLRTAVRNTRGVHERVAMPLNLVTGVHTPQINAHSVPFVYGNRFHILDTRKDTVTRVTVATLATLNAIKSSTAKATDVQPLGVATAICWAVSAGLLPAPTMDVIGTARLALKISTAMDPL